MDVKTILFASENESNHKKLLLPQSVNVNYDGHACIKIKYCKKEKPSLVNFTVVLFGVVHSVHEDAILVKYI